MPSPTDNASDDPSHDPSDNPDGLHLGPPPVRLLSLAGLAVLLAAAAVFSDLAGRVLTVPMLLGTLAVLGRDLALRPVLAADETGLSLVVGVRRVAVTWPEVEGLRVVRERRTPLLEVDLGASVLVAAPGRLGVPPQVALEQLQALRAAAR